ncbi:NAD(P)H-dependent oxidoreductase [Anaeromicropila herbilytica]|uniref:Flavodoxin family protein n=1 Tax=Anaeromicropila herbilytica TaxID=2785025 RepID=A0A7R7ICU0_9FIRM|nr:NAD(P)H-dependent oxidoreductase [Anaeromicropila herbilytica]BCN30877.1 flavodoxin family protein [Anaeromicropila herbilytica]
MKIFVVYCHPSKNSFTYQVKEEFLKGLRDANHTFIVSDLYEMNFNSELSEGEYEREAFYRSEIPVANDVLEEQRKIQESDAIVFIYPVFWTEAPAKLVGWFDRVWSSGFAYNPNPQMKVLKKALFILSAGKTMESLEETGEANAMRTVMLGDRIRTRAIEKEMIMFDGTSHWNEAERNVRIIEHLKTAYNLGVNF